MDENTVMIDLNNVKKKYVIRHKIKNPTAFRAGSSLSQEKSFTRPKERIQRTSGLWTAYLFR